MKKLLISIAALLLVASPSLAGSIDRTDLTSGQPASLKLSAVDAGADTFINDNRTLFVVENTSGTAATVTITAQKSELSTQGFGVLQIADLTFDVANGDSVVAVPAGSYNNSNGRVEVSYAGDTSAVSVGAFRRSRD